jgi:hypothetical protein
MTKWASTNDVAQLVIELRKLRQSIERVQAGLLNVEDTARYLAISDVTLRDWIRRGLVPVTEIDPDARTRRFSRNALDRLIAERTHVQGDVQ